MKYMFDSKMTEKYPQSIQNMARFIGIDHEFIMVGDIYKSF
jgi:hypothetical protein